jgi:cold shock CspA family protein
MPEKVKGTVKWFSNRKGFGFITPSSDNAPTIEDIFVHQSNIVTEKETYRTLKDGFEVEFEVITDTNGKLKAENVTSDDGSPCPGPEPRERRKRNKNKGLAGESGDENGGEKSDEEPKDPAAKGRGRRRNGKKGSNEKKPSWEDDLDESVKEGMESRKIKILAGKTFLAIGDARVKLGNGG